MRRNYGQANRGTATARPRAGASRRRMQQESYGSAGQSSRSGMRRGPQPAKKNNQNVVIGIVIGCAVILLIVVLVAMNGSGESSGLEEKLKEKDPGTYEPSTETGKIVDKTPTESDETKKNNDNPVISNPKENDVNNAALIDEDDDPSWHEKDPDYKGKDLGNREGFNK